MLAGLGVGPPEISVASIGASFVVSEPPFVLLLIIVLSEEEAAQYQGRVVLKVLVQVQSIFLLHSCCLALQGIVCVVRPLVNCLLHDFFQFTPVDQFRQRLEWVPVFHLWSHHLNDALCQVLNPLQVQLNVLECCPDLGGKTLDGLSHQLFILSLPELDVKDLLNSFLDDIFEDGEGFRHAETGHGPEGGVKHVVLEFEVDPTKDEAEPEHELHLAGSVEGRQEVLLEVELFETVHEHVDPVEEVHHLVVVADHLPEVINPRVQVAGGRQPLELEALLGQQVVHFQVEQAEEVGPPTHQSAVDFNELPPGLREDLIHQVGLAAGLLAVQHEG